MVNTFTSYQQIARDMTRSLARVQSEPVVKRETEYYLANIEKVKSVDDFMRDDRLYRYAMKAFGLEDMAYAKAFMRKVLEGGVEDRGSFANKLSDTRYKEFAETFNFARDGAATADSDRVRKGVVDKHLRQTLEEDAGKQNEGVRLALYLERKGPGIENFYQVLGDRALGKVVRTILGLPDSFAQADVDKQVQMFKQRLDIKDFSDPKGLQKLLTRFTSMWEIGNPSSARQTPMIALFGQPPEFGISTDVLLTLARMKR